jgi:predicted protein tyrosine phosphatase
MHCFVSLSTSTAAKALLQSSTARAMDNKTAVNLSLFMKHLHRLEWAKTPNKRLDIGTKLKYFSRKLPTINPDQLTETGL